jgi:hypothetical protein
VDWLAVGLEVCIMFDPRIKIYGQVPNKFYVGFFLLILVSLIAFCDPMPDIDSKDKTDIPIGMQNL